jgi:hypothetical protein
MRALTTRVEWLKARAGTSQSEMIDRSAWDWHAGSCSCDLPPGECGAYPRARPTQRLPAGNKDGGGNVKNRKDAQNPGKYSVATPFLAMI